MFELQPDDVEEANSKCHICSAGLSYLEISLYGNRCVFCADKIKNIRLLTFLIRAYYDWKLYQFIAATKFQEEGRNLLIGCLGEIGFRDINECRRVKNKKALLKALFTGLTEKSIAARKETLLLPNAT